MEIFSLCIKIFIVRVIDVAIGTIGTIITIKGNKFIASIMGFIEAFIWFLIVREAITTDVESLWIAFSYSLGYGVGTYLGSYLSKRFINTVMGIQVILSSKNDIAVNTIRNNGYAVTVLDVKCQNDERYLLMIEIHDKRYNELINLIKKLDSKAFIIANENKHVINGYFGSMKSYNH